MSKIVELLVEPFNEIAREYNASIEVIQKTIVTSGVLSRHKSAQVRYNVGTDRYILKFNQAYLKDRGKPIGYFADIGVHEIGHILGYYKKTAYLHGLDEDQTFMPLVPQVVNNLCGMDEGFAELIRLRFSSKPDRLRQGNEDKEFVINRSPNSWIRHFNQITESAGLDKIPRPFDNMRASRATEVCNEYGAKQESVWLGHSEKTAMKYYLMVTDDDYAIAAGRKKQCLGQAAR